MKEAVRLGGLFFVMNIITSKNNIEKVYDKDVIFFFSLSNPAR